MIQANDTVADFTLDDQDSRPTPWRDFRGKPVVVFFYPKANTPGCTAEACAYNDLYSEFLAAGAAVVGVSADSVRKQFNFRAKHGLTMPLLSDADHQVLGPWGVWGTKTNYGRTYMGIRRTTVLFDARGRVVQVWENVRVKGHVDQVLARVRELADQAGPTP